MMHGFRIGLCLVVVGVAGCSDATGPTDDLMSNRRLWLSQYLPDYTYEYERWCFCQVGPQPVRLTVHGDSIVAAVVIATGQNLTPTEIANAGFRTVNELFTVILDAIAQGADELEVEYDPRLGYPRLIAIDPDHRTVDEEVTYRTANLVGLQPR